jgi:hypothetical protein
VRPDIPRAQQEDVCRGRGEGRDACDRNSDVRLSSFKRVAVGVVGTLVVLVLSVREGRAQSMAGVTVRSDCSAPLAEYLKEPNPGQVFLGTVRQYSAPVPPVFRLLQARGWDVLEDRSQQPRRKLGRAVPLSSRGPDARGDHHATA